MQVPVIPSFVEGEVTTGQQLNSLGAAGNLLLAPPILQVQQTSIQTGIANITWTPILFNSVILDRDAGWSTSNQDTYTVQTAGYWMGIFSMAWSVNATGNRLIELLMNGIECGTNKTLGDGSTNAQLTTVGASYLAAGQTIQARGYQSSGGVLNSAIYGQSPSLTLFRLSS